MPQSLTSTWNALSASRWLPLSGALAGSVLLALAASAQPVAFGKVRNFRVPEYYDAPYQNQMKSLLSGAEAEPQPNGLFRIREVRLETFRESGERELVLTAPQCVYDSRQRTATSAGGIQAESDDGRLWLEGEGFLWRQADRTFILSNRVHSVFWLPPRKRETGQQQMKASVLASLLLTGLAATAAAQPDSAATTSSVPAATSAPVSTARSLVAGWSQIDIRSEQGTLSRQSNVWVLVYWRNVRGVAPRATLTCEYLTGTKRDGDRSFASIVAETNVIVDFARPNGEQVHGTGSKLEYSSTVSGGATNETFELTGDPPPVVTGQQFTNIADVFIYDVTHDSLRFKNPHTRIRLPERGTSGTNAAPKTNAPSNEESPKPGLPDSKAPAGQTGFDQPPFSRRADE